MKKVSIKISDMHCASCALNISRNLSKETGIIKADVNFPMAKANIDYDEKIIDIKKIESVIENTGYHVDHEETSSRHHDHNKMMMEKLSEEDKQKKHLLFSLFFAAPVVLSMFWHWQIPGNILGTSNTNIVLVGLAAIVVFGFGYSFHKSTISLLIKRQTSMDTLISLGTMSAFFYSTWALFYGGDLYFDSAATITVLILLGHYLELKTRGRANRAMEKLMQLGAKQAHLIDQNGDIHEIEIEKIKIDNILLVKPGEKMPLDGIIIEGATTTDESMLSGESLPQNKKSGDQVFAATINLNGLIKIKVTKTSNETVFAQILKTVEETQSFKAPIQRLADKISGVFVPVVIFIAFLTWAAWYYYSGNFSLALINAVAVLIISCPCALGIATPIAVMVGASVSAKNGILIKDGESFEKAKKIDTVIFDKTGTLTKGTPQVQNIVSRKNFDADTVLKIAASLGINSSHPLSQALISKAKEKNVKTITVTNFQEVPGQGMRGECQEHHTKIMAGNLELLRTNDFTITEAEQILNLPENQGATVIFIVHGKELAGYILIADEIKETAFAAIKKIQALNLEPMIISGDNEFVTKTVAEKLGVENFLANVLPQEKQKAVKAIQDQGKKVVFVGDGINDAPSLIQADLGIAMGSGTDIAKEAGNIIILKNDPEKVVQALQLSQKTFTVIKQNLFWAFFYNTLAIPLAAFGLINPMIGAIAMGLSDVNVIGNSLRIYRNPRNI